jgi:hypothetical protein
MSTNTSTIAILLIAFLLAGCSQPKPSDLVEVVDTEIETKISTEYVIFTIENTSDKELAYVEAVVDGYDEEGVVVESNFCNIHDVLPGMKQKCKVVFFDLNHRYVHRKWDVTVTHEERSLTDMHEPVGRTVFER